MWDKIIGKPEIDLAEVAKLLRLYERGFIERWEFEESAHCTPERAYELTKK